MYKLPPPPSGSSDNTAATITKAANSFGRKIGEAAIGDGLVTVPASVKVLGPRHYSAFWAAVADKMKGSGWKLKPSGMRDAGATRCVVLDTPT